MNILLLLLITLFSAPSAMASPHCYEVEKNTESEGPFTLESWQSLVNEWEAFEPSQGNFFDWPIALFVYKSEKQTALNMQGDKRRHCYIGCRISQATSLEMATYVAWWKESRDLSDCDASTSFELEDYHYTLFGAEIGEESEDPRVCLDSCSQLSRDQVFSI